LFFSYSLCKMAEQKREDLSSLLHVVQSNTQPVPTREKALVALFDHLTELSTDQCIAILHLPVVTASSSGTTPSFGITSQQRLVLFALMWERAKFVIHSSSSSSSTSISISQIVQLVLSLTEKDLPTNFPSIPTSKTSPVRGFTDLVPGDNIAAARESLTTFLLGVSFML